MSGLIKDPLLLNIPMPITTPRLLIRPRQAGEGPVIARAVRDSIEHLKPWMPFAQQKPTDELMEEHCQKAVLNFQKRTDFTLSIYNPSGKILIGSTGLHSPNWSVPSFHIGYWVRPDFQGRGLVTEAVNALTRYAFSVFGAQRVSIFCDSRNLRSVAVMIRLGFVQEGLLRNEDRAPDGTLRDTIVTARTDLVGLPDLEVKW